MELKIEDYVFMNVKFVKGNVIATFEDVNYGIITKKSNIYPHDDLVIALKAFDDKLREIFLVTKSYSKHVKCNGITVQYKGVNMLTSISGLMISKSGANLKIVSDFISMDGEGYGFEKDLNVMVKTLSDEVYYYVTMKKKGETSNLEDFIGEEEEN